LYSPSPAIDSKPAALKGHTEATMSAAEEESNDERIYELEDDLGFLQDSIASRTEQIRSKTVTLRNNKKVIADLEHENQCIEAQVDEMTNENKKEKEQAGRLKQLIARMKRDTERTMPVISLKRTGSKPAPKPSTKRNLDDDVSEIDSDDSDEVKRPLLSFDQGVYHPLAHRRDGGQNNQKNDGNTGEGEDDRGKGIERPFEIPELGFTMPAYEPLRHDEYMTGVNLLLGFSKESDVKEWTDLNDVIGTMKTLVGILGPEHQYHEEYKKTFGSDAEWQRLFNHNDNLDDSAKLEILKHRIACIRFHVPVRNNTQRQESATHNLQEQRDALAETGQHEAVVRAPTIGTPLQRRERNANSSAQHGGLPIFSVLDPAANSSRHQSLSQRNSAALPQVQGPYQSSAALPEVQDPAQSWATLPQVQDPAQSSAALPQVLDPARDFTALSQVQTQPSAALPQVQDPAQSSAALPQVQDPARDSTALPQVQAQSSAALPQVHDPALSNQKPLAGPSQQQNVAKPPGQHENDGFMASKSPHQTIQEPPSARQTRMEASAGPKPPPPGAVSIPFTRNDGCTSSITRSSAGSSRPPPHQCSTHAPRQVGTPSSQRKSAPRSSQPIPEGIELESAGHQIGQGPLVPTDGHTDQHPGRELTTHGHKHRRSGSFVAGGSKRPTHEHLPAAYPTSPITRKGSNRQAPPLPPTFPSRRRQQHQLPVFPLPQFAPPLGASQVGYNFDNQSDDQSVASIYSLRSQPDLLLPVYDPQHPEAYVDAVKTKLGIFSTTSVRNFKKWTCQEKIRALKGMLGPDHHYHTIDNFKERFIHNGNEAHWNNLFKTKDLNSDHSTLKDRILFILHLKAPSAMA
jgi:hypothetical protein